MNGHIGGTSRQMENERVLTMKSATNWYIVWYRNFWDQNSPQSWSKP